MFLLIRFGFVAAGAQLLYDTLCATEPHFIKCVKTNTVKRPGVFDSTYALRQLQVRVFTTDLHPLCTPAYTVCAHIDGAAGQN